MAPLILQFEVIMWQGNKRADEKHLSIYMNSWIRLVSLLLSQEKMYTSSFATASPHEKYLSIDLGRSLHIYGSNLERMVLEWNASCPLFNTFIADAYYYSVIWNNIGKNWHELREVHDHLEDLSASTRTWPTTQGSAKNWPVRSD